MAKIKITETNGASAKDISDAIGEFLAQIDEKEENGKEIDEIEETD